MGRGSRLEGIEWESGSDKPHPLSRCPYSRYVIDLHRCMDIY